MVPGLVHKTFQSFDGTRIAYQVRGPVNGPAIVLANGLGGTFEAYRHVYAALGDRYRILCWDYRGLYRSERPRDLATLSIENHCRDLDVLLAVENVKHAVFVGWSMGVQVNFEFFRHHRHLMRAMVAINGTYGAPFRTLLASRLTRYAVPGLLALMKRRSKAVSMAARHAIDWPGLVPLLKRSGLASREIDGEALAVVAADFKNIDFALYSDQLKALGRHDARDLLPSIDVPVLIMTGDKDLMTPLFTAHKMNRLIAGSRLMVLPGGTHYTPLEYGAAIGHELRRFIGSIRGFQVAEAA